MSHKLSPISKCVYTVPSEVRSLAKIHLPLTVLGLYCHKQVLGICQLRAPDFSFYAAAISKPIQSSVMRSKRWVWLSVRERNQKLFRLSRDLGTLLLIFLETPLEEVCTDWEGSVSLNVGMWKVPQLHSGTTVYIGVGSQTPNSSYSKISTHDGQVWVSSSTRSWEVSKAPNPDCTDDTDLELEVHIWSRFQYLPFLLLHQSLWSMPKHK